MAKVLTDTASLTALADAIRSKSGKTEGLIYPEGFVSAVEEISDEKWQYVTNCDSLFRDSVFPDGYELTVDVPKVTSILNMFYGIKGVSKITLKGNTAGTSFVGTAVFRNTSAETIDISDFGLKLSSASGTFQQSASLREIIGEIDFSECTMINAPFQYCSRLESVSIMPNSMKASISFSSSSLLSDSSVQSIIDGLADVTEETTQVLTLHADVKARLTQEQLTAITQKNWSVA